MIKYNLKITRVQVVTLFIIVACITLFFLFNGKSDNYDSIEWEFRELETKQVSEPNSGESFSEPVINSTDSFIPGITAITDIFPFFFLVVAVSIVVISLGVITNLRGRI